MKHYRKFNKRHLSESTTLERVSNKLTGVSVCVCVCRGGGWGRKAGRIALSFHNCKFCSVHVDDSNSCIRLSTSSNIYRIYCIYIKSTIINSNSLISNNHLSRSEALIYVFNMEI